MTSYQSNKLAMYSAVLEFLREFASSTIATSMFPALAAKIAALEALFKTLIATAARQEQPADGAFEQRERALRAAAEATTIVAGAVLSYARTHRQPELAAHVRRVRTEMWQMRRAERMRIAQRVHDLAGPLAPQLTDFGLTAGILDDLQTQIAAAEQAVTAAVDTQTARQVSTKQLHRLFADIDGMLAEIDPMLLKLQTIDRPRHDEYLVRRSITARPATNRRVSEPDTSVERNTIPAQLPVERQAA